MRKIEREIEMRNGFLNGPMGREARRRTQPEKKRPEMPWRRKISEFRKAVRMHQFSMLFGCFHCVFDGTSQGTALERWKRKSKPKGI